MYFIRLPKFSNFYLIIGICAKRSNKATYTEFTTASQKFPSKTRVIKLSCVNANAPQVRSAHRFLHYFSMQMFGAIASHCKSNLNYFL